MKILISERMTARKSCIEPFGKPVFGLPCLPAWHFPVWRIPPAFRERLALKGILPPVHDCVKALVNALTALTWIVSCSAWAADIPAMSAGTAGAGPSVVAVATAAAPAITAATDAALAAATGGAMGAADISRDEAAAGLFGKHNFTASGIATGEICAFCHAPQGMETSVTAPLWNRSRSPMSDYQAYSTLGSATAAASGSVSMACLSCHDGTQAPNVIINTPGKDGNDADSINGTRTDSSQFLKDHHPVGMQYAGGGPNHTIPGAPFKLENFRSTSYTGTGTGTVWWVDTGGNGRQKSDLLLFTRADTPQSESVGRPYVECASCHDPHNISNPTFLRAANPGSGGLCMTCHAK